MDLDEKKISTNIGIKGKTLKKLDKHCKITGKSRSELVGELIEIGLQTYLLKK